MSDDDHVNFRVIMCRPLNPEKYPATARLIYDQIVAANGEPTIYTHSKQQDCQLCGTAIAVGPQQQRQIAVWRQQQFTYRVLCFVCVIRVESELFKQAENEGAELELMTIDLGNPEGRR